MLMTYYCPTHGDSGIVEPVEISKKEIRETLLKKDSNSKNNYWEKIQFSSKSLIIFVINKLLITKFSPLKNFKLD